MTACMAACLPTCMSACSPPPPIYLLVCLHAYLPLYRPECFFCLHLCLQVQYVCPLLETSTKTRKVSYIVPPPPLQYTILCSKQIAYANLAFYHSRPYLWLFVSDKVFDCLIHVQYVFTPKYFFLYSNVVFSHCKPSHY